MRRFFFKDKIIIETKIDKKDFLFFQKMLLKMKKQRPQLNVNRILRKLYGDHFKIDA